VGGAVGDLDVLGEELEAVEAGVLGGGDFEVEFSGRGDVDGGEASVGVADVAPVFGDAGARVFGAVGGDGDGGCPGVGGVEVFELEDVAVVSAQADGVPTFFEVFEFPFAAYEIGGVCRVYDLPVSWRAGAVGAVDPVPPVYAGPAVCMMSLSESLSPPLTSGGGASVPMSPPSSSISAPPPPGSVLEEYVFGGVAMISVMWTPS